MALKGRAFKARRKDAMKDLRLQPLR